MTKTYIYMHTIFVNTKLYIYIVNTYGKIYSTRSKFIMKISSIHVHTKIYYADFISYYSCNHVLFLLELMFELIFSTL